MAQDHGLCRKKKKCQMDPAHGPPLQARVAAANGTVLAACKLLALTRHDDPGAHGNGQGQTKQNERGKATERGQMMRAVGMAGKGWQQAHSPKNKTTAGGHSQRILRPAQASKN